jgi:SAM-dependent methyltransferase
VTSKPADHYSYGLYADPDTAEHFDARRFGGPIGELVAAAQARVLLEMAGDVRGRSALDVGAGTGRAALLLASAGAAVTAVDASDQMLAVARQRAAAAGLAIHFTAGDAQALEFGDRSFDIVVSLRVLMHTIDWRQSVAELCRIADRRVIVDYPSARSAAAVESVVRRTAHAFGRRNEPYRVLSDRSVRRAFGRNGFRLTGVHRQFVLPIALHKAIGSRGFTDTAEGLLRRSGLLRLFGSPVTVVAERCGS